MVSVETVIFGQKSFRIWPYSSSSSSSSRSRSSSGGSGIGSGSSRRSRSSSRRRRDVVAVLTDCLGHPWRLFTFSR